MAQYGSVSAYRNNDIAVVRNNRVDVNLEVGPIRATGHSTYVSSTYAARYNFAVRQYNTLDDEYLDQKWSMRGGRFFLFNIVAFLFFCGSIGCYINSERTKSIIAAPIVISVIYLLITCYNWHIYRKNGSLVHDRMIRVDDDDLPNSTNKHLTIPLNANVQNREIIAATDGSVVAIAAQLRQRYVNLTEIDVMLYESNYVKYMRFPMESIVHFLAFVGVFIAAVLRLVDIINKK